MKNSIINNFKSNDIFKAVKYINDPIYGSIPINKIELDLINLPIFQRLRNLKQLGSVSYVFPSAEHNRFIHSLGVLYIMQEMTDWLYMNGHMGIDDIKIMRVAALLHDIGHYPFSHLGESVYGYVSFNKNSEDMISDCTDKNSDEKIYEYSAIYNKAADHEVLGAYIIENNEDIQDVLKKYNFTDADIRNIGYIIRGIAPQVELGEVYVQLLHSSLDADRLDYLIRDSYYTGVNYGLVDLDYLIKLMDVRLDELTKRKIIVFKEKGKHALEHFLFSRYFHYSQVIFHKTNSSFEGLLKVLFVKLLNAKNVNIFKNYEEIKQNINSEKFIFFTDYEVLSLLNDYYKETSDDDFKYLYKKYINRSRPKVVYTKKELFTKSNQKLSEIDRLLDIIKREPEKITEILKTELWGYQNPNVSISSSKVSTLKKEDIEEIDKLTRAMECLENIGEDITKLDKANEKRKKLESKLEEARESIKIILNNDKISYLAIDEESMLSKVIDYTNSFIYIFIYEPENIGDSELKRIRDRFENLTKY